jgi:hypothetical protein
MEKLNTCFRIYYITSTWGKRGENVAGLTNLLSRRII